MSGKNTPTKQVKAHHQPLQSQSSEEQTSLLSQKLVDEIVENVARRIDELNITRRTSMVSLPSSPPAALSKAHARASLTSSGGNKPKVVRTLHYRETLPANAKYVELTMTARNLKNDYLSGGVYFNTNDKKVDRDMSVNVSMHRTNRYQAKGRRVSNSLRLKSIEMLESRLNDKVEAIKTMLDRYGYSFSDMFEVDLTQSAKIREGASRIAFEKMLVFKRVPLPDEESDEEESDGQPPGVSDDDQSVDDPLDEEDDDSAENSNDYDEVDVSNAVK